MAESVTPLVCPLKVTGLLPSNADQIRNWKSDAPLSITISINKYSYGNQQVTRISRMYYNFWVPCPEGKKRQVVISATCPFNSLYIRMI